MSYLHDTKFRPDDDRNFIAPFLIAFFSGMMVAGFCAFLHVIITNALTTKRLEFLPDPRKVRVKMMKGKKGKKSKKSKATGTTAADEEGEEGTGTTAKTGTKGGSTMGTATATGKSKMSTAKEKTDKTTDGQEM